MAREHSESDPKTETPEDRTHASEKGAEMGAVIAETGEDPSPAEDESPPKMGKGVATTGFTSVEDEILDPPGETEEPQDSDGSPEAVSDSADSPGLFSGLVGNGEDVHQASLKTPFTPQQPSTGLPPERRIRELQKGTDGKFTWEGLPYEGPVLDYKSNDPDERLPQLVRTVCTDLFDMSDAEDRQNYSNVIENVMRGQYLMIREDRRPNKSGSWAVLLTYAKQKYVAPNIKRV